MTLSDLPPVRVVRAEVDVEEFKVVLDVRTGSLE